VKSKSWGSRICVAITFAGFVATGGYLIYTKFLSGWPAGQFKPERVAAGTPIPAGIAPEPSDAEFLAAVSLKLSPDMNPVRLTWTSKIAGGGAVQSKERARFNVMLFHGDRQLFYTSVFVGNEPDTITTRQIRGLLGRHAVPIGVVDVPIADTYTLYIDEAGFSQLRVRDVRIEVWRNVLPFDMRIALAGFGVVILGLVLRFYFLIREF
jgi:hypothetical protein